MATCGSRTTFNSFFRRLVELRRTASSPSSTFRFFGRRYSKRHGRSGRSSLWFTEFLRDKIGRITPLGVVTEFGLTPGTAPEAITTGPDGNLWFTGLGRIGRITPAGVVTEFTAGITAGALIQGITAAPDGNLWFTEYNDRIGRITPQGNVTEFAFGVTPGAGPVSITTGPDGNLWFTEFNGDRIGRITLGPISSPMEIPTTRPWTLLLLSALILTLTAAASAAIRDVR